MTQLVRRKRGGLAKEPSREAATSRHLASLRPEAQGPATIADPRAIGRADLKSASPIPVFRKTGKRRGRLAKERPATIADPPARRRGGQPGNANNLKHGLYSVLVSVRDDVELTPMHRDRSDDELAFARVRLKQLVLKQRTAPDGDWLSYEKAIQHYIDRIAMITHRNAVLGRTEVAAYVTVMDMIRQANDEQEVT